MALEETPVLMPILVPVSVLAFPEALKLVPVSLEELKLVLELEERLVGVVKPMLMLALVPVQALTLVLVPVLVRPEVLKLVLE